jgi:hypothetical protein
VSAALVGVERPLTTVVIVAAFREMAATVASDRQIDLIFMARDKSRRDGWGLGEGAWRRFFQPDETSCGLLRGADDTVAVMGRAGFGGKPVRVHGRVESDIRRSQREAEVRRAARSPTACPSS